MREKDWTSAGFLPEAMHSYCVCVHVCVTACVCACAARLNADRHSRSAVCVSPSSVHSPSHQDNSQSEHTFLPKLTCSCTPVQSGERSRCLDVRREEVGIWLSGRPNKHFVAWNNVILFRDAPNSSPAKTPFRSRQNTV